MVSHPDDLAPDQDPYVARALLHAQILTARKQSGWTDDRVAVAKRLWLDGYSAQLIARELGHVSRNAVIGKIHRMGLQNRCDPGWPTRVRMGLCAIIPAKPRTDKPKRQQRTRQRKRVARAPVQAAAVIRRTSLPPQPVAPPAVVDASKAKPWTERRFGECAYPIAGEGADALSCCVETDGTYCAPHRAIMYRPFDTKPKEFLRSLRRFA